jgi:predicted AAA+ superfamily ATPase
VDEKPYYILLDEVQLLEEFEEVLNSLLHIKNVDVYVTGSNSKFLSKDVMERHHIEKPQELEDLVNVLASAIGSLNNVPKIEATFNGRAWKRIRDKYAAEHQIEDGVLSLI